MARSSVRCSRDILKNVDTYAAKAYRSRFAEIAESQTARSHCAR